MADEILPAAVRDRLAVRDDSRARRAVFGDGEKLVAVARVLAPRACASGEPARSQRQQAASAEGATAHGARRRPHRISPARAAQRAKMRPASARRRGRKHEWRDITLVTLPRLPFQTPNADALREVNSHESSIASVLVRGSRTVETAMPDPCPRVRLRKSSGENTAPSWRIGIGDSGRARTCDLPLRRRLLYPAELRSRASIPAPHQCDHGDRPAGRKLSG